MTIPFLPAYLNELGAGYDIYLDGSQPNKLDYDITTSISDEGLRIEGPVPGVLEVVACMGHVAQYEEGALKALLETFADAETSFNGDTNELSVRLPHFTGE